MIHNNVYTNWEIKHGEMYKMLFTNMKNLSSGTYVIFVDKKT